MAGEATLWRADHRSGLGLTAWIWTDLDDPEGLAARARSRQHPAAPRVLGASEGAVVVRPARGQPLLEWLRGAPPSPWRWAVLDDVASLSALVGAAPPPSRVWVDPEGRATVLGAELGGGSLGELAEALLHGDRSTAARAAKEVLATTLEPRAAAGAVGALRHAAALEDLTGQPKAPAAPRRVSELVGREREIAAVEAALERTGLATICGPAGIGKTALADAVAKGEDHALWVVAEGADTGSDLVAAVAVAVGTELTFTGAAQADARAAGRALRRVGDRLLVLDNLEQVVDEAAGLVLGWKEAAPSLRVLVTSRIALGLADEAVLDLKPLPLPDAVSLLQRSADRPGWADAATARRIVEAVDRLPLAIELAAGRAPTLTATELARRLEADLAPLSSGQRRDPRARLDRAIEGSWALLPPAARQDLADLSVFAAPFPPAAAESVLGGDDALDRLALLRRHSWLHPVGERLGIYAALSTFVRKSDPPPRAAAADRHARWFSAEARDALDRLWGPDGPSAERRLLAAAADLDRAAAHGPDPDRALGQLTAWRLRGEVPRAEEAAARWLDEGVGGQDLALHRGLWRWQRGDVAGARADAARGRGEPAGALVGGLTLLVSGNLVRAERALEQAAGGLADAPLRAWAATRAAEATARQGRLQAADTKLQPELERLDHLGAPALRADAWAIAGDVARGRGHEAAAVAAFSRSASEADRGRRPAMAAWSTFAAIPAADALPPLLERLAAAGRPDLEVRAWRLVAPDPLALDAARRAGDLWAFVVAVGRLIEAGRRAPTGSRAEARDACERLGWSAGRGWLDGGQRPPIPGLAPPSDARLPDALPTDRLVLERSARWFQAPGAAAVDLGGHGPGRRILEALIAALPRGRRLSLAQLIDAGWPDGDVPFDAARNRAWVALSGLRKLGLKEALHRDSDGYGLVGDPLIVDGAHSKAD